MSRTSARLAAVATAVVLATTGAATSATAATPATGSAVVNESNTFLINSLSAGVMVFALPTATGSYDSATGLSAAFPVTGGAANLPSYYGDVQLGGGLLFINLRTGKTAVFKNLSFNVGNWQITGVPQGGTTSVALLDPAGDTTVAGNAAASTLTASDLQVDEEGAKYLDTKLNTTFFTAGQSVGSLNLTFKAGS
ncbi:hypothetical protein SAMN05216371_4110 [Streptomyces sp. TLI_053]|uniref:hypothetical protein n=1 Tax=Streptomyces sp. TLI_053 TaxID=1855352 RepID=UPI0008792C34|nr:hypothetical protein [Streptomyces sp. TLI_053]SDT71384.1 hypothetical protein SAMN05216371_4110 [Streptomyces sp. TLI_053]